MKLSMIISRLAAFAILWIALGGTAADPAIGLLAIGAATLASGILWRGRIGIRPAALLRFLPYFIGRSLRGAWDVSRRALSPHMQLHPELHPFPLRLETGRARVFFSWTVSLCPGTASVSLDGDELVIHVLDRELLHEAKLRETEWIVGAIFGERPGG